MSKTNARRRRWKRSRPAARVEALLRGKFWTPCPRCGTSFGGHEWRTGHSIPHPSIPDRYRGICPPCAYDIGEAFEEICETEGHELTSSWSPEQTILKHEGREVEQLGSFDLRMPPSEMYCSRCFMEFDPLTHVSVGRPL